MSSDRVQVNGKSSFRLTPGFKPEKSIFLKRRYQDQVEAQTDSFTEDKPQSSSEQSNPTPLLGHSFGRVSVFPIQTKLTVGEPGDVYEREADRVATQVVQQLKTPQTQWQEMPEEEEEELQMKTLVQRQPNGGTASADLETSIESARGQGQPLENHVCVSMEQAFGADFRGVRVHTDARSDQLNQSVQARAFTTGQDIFFKEGEYQPENRGGQELLAHELTHVVQQTSSIQIDPGKTQQLIQRDLDAPPTMNRPVPVSNPRERRAEEAQAINRQSRERMAQVMMQWERGELVFNFRSPDGRAVGDRFISWIAGNYQVRTNDPNVVLDQIVMLSTHFIVNKLYPLRNANLPSSSHIGEIDWEIRSWTEVAELARTASSEEEFWNAYYAFKIKNEDIVDIIHQHYPEVEQSQGRSEPEPKLTAQQISQLRQLIEEMPYSELERGYIAVNRWIDEQLWLGRIKTSIESSNTIVETAYDVDVELVSETTKNSLELMSKLIGTKGDFDQIFRLATAGKQVHGEENEVLFAAFISYWKQNGWLGMMDYYRTLRNEDNQPAYTGLTAAQFLNLEPPTQVTIALNIGQVLRLSPHIRYEQFAASFRETFNIASEFTWWALEKAFLSRIPGWAILKLTVNSSADVISLLNDLSESEAIPPG